MEFKKSIIITLFLCSLLIGSVHAASDTNDTLSSDARYEPIKHMDTKQIDKTLNSDNDIKSYTIPTSHSHDKTTDQSSANKNNNEKADQSTKNSQKIPKITTLSILFFYFKLIITIN